MPRIPPNAAPDAEPEVHAKPITMEAIGKMAGVHSRTVADALKGKGRVAPATREKVLRIAKELNYVPNAAARALATGRTGTVAVLSGPFNESYYANMLHFLESQLTASGYEMTLLHARRPVGDLLQATQSSLVDGVIIIGSNHFPEAFLRARSKSSPPCVLVDTAEPDFADHITLDLRPAVEEALQLMLAARRQRIAYVANNRDQAAHNEIRMKTYLQAMKQANRAEEIIDVDTQAPPEARIRAIKTAVEENGCPDALLCQNDETAIYTFRALVELGYRIPNDALMVGCDGLPYMEFFEPPLSTIALPTSEICAVAVQFLQERMADPNAPLQRATMQGRLMVRKSLQVTL